MNTTTPTTEAVRLALRTLIDAAMELGHESDALRAAIYAHDVACGCEAEDGPALAPMDAFKALTDALRSEVAS